MAGSERDDVARLGDADVALVVLGAEMGGDRLGIFGLVIAGLLEPDREGAHRGRAIFLVERDDGRLSIPPDRKAPTGTSASDWPRIASAKVVSSMSSASLLVGDRVAQAGATTSR
jgi:hypothetical protein